MRDYFLRRLLLIPITLFGITIIAFFITRLVPGGPIERALAESQMLDLQGSSSSSGGQSAALSEDQIKQLEKFYGFDKPWYIAYFYWVGNLLKGNLGDSFRYQEPVWDIIIERFPISIYYGLTTLIITYSTCIPLGIIKAIRHRTFIDNLSSILIFAGYAVPGYALGALLVVFFAARLEWFPMGGFISDNFADYTLIEKIWDILHHSFLPLICYLVGSFAILTLLMKNHLMDNLAADFIRTAIAKGVDFKTAVVKHALRNSMIPIATNLGQVVGIFMTGSFLIETIYDIDGIGLLGYTSIVDRDYPVVMGVLLLTAFLLLIGNIISDICVALVDPRVRFK